MNIQQQLDYLINQLLSEKAEYRTIKVPETIKGKKQLLRALVNVRPPAFIDDAFLKIQDAYLQGEIAAKVIVSIKDLSSTTLNDKLYLYKGDITILKVDAIVNAANSKLLGCFIPSHHCIDNAIHSYAGIQLRNACEALMKNQSDEATGEAKITKAYNLPSKHILHTVGPIINHPLNEGDKQLLANCYTACLNLAVDNNLKSIAFCCISTGEFGFPKKEAAEIAVKTIETFLSKNNQLEAIVFNVFTGEDYDYYKKLLG